MGHKVTENSVQKNVEFHTDLHGRLKEEILALNEKSNMQQNFMTNFKTQIGQLEHTIESVQHEVETKEEINEELKKKNVNLTEACNRLSTEVRKLNKTVIDLEQSIDMKD